MTEDLAKAHALFARPARDGVPAVLPTRARRPSTMAFIGDVVRLRADGTPRLRLDNAHLMAANRLALDGAR